MFKNSYTSKIFRNFKSKIKKPKFTSELILENAFKIFALIQNYSADSSMNGKLESSTKVNQI